MKTARDVLLHRWGRSGTGSQPTVLPRMSRLHLAALSVEMGWTRGAEIGVWKGGFSEVLLRGNPRLHLLCVDPWQAHADWLDSKNAIDPVDGQRKVDKAYRAAMKTLAGLNCTIVRKFSEAAAADVPDQSLDFVYIDANHVYDAVSQDLQAWTPKVKPGGIIAGHDYRVWREKPTIHVVKAVNDFTTAHAIRPWFVLGADRSPSFLWEAA